MKLFGFEISERNGNRLKTDILLTLNKINKTTIVDIYARLR